MGKPVLDEHQHSPGHQEQPLHLGGPGGQPAALLHFDAVRTPLTQLLSLSLQLGVPHTFVMMSYQHKFQDEDQTKIKGSVKCVLS